MVKKKYTVIRTYEIKDNLFDMSTAKLTWIIKIISSQSVYNGLDLPGNRDGVYSGKAMHVGHIPIRKKLGYYVTNNHIYNRNASVYSSLIL